MYFTGNKFTGRNFGCYYFRNLSAGPFYFHFAAPTLSVRRKYAVRKSVFYLGTIFVRYHFRVLKDVNIIIIIRATYNIYIYIIITGTFGLENV